MWPDERCKMNIKKGKKYTNEVGKVVEVIDVGVINHEDHVIGLVLYASKEDTEREGFLKIDKIHTLTMSDFLEEYKTYEDVYEYQENKWVTPMPNTKKT